ncbi:hypothetical protein DFJ74DRAFT_720635 [Hyaloraphidium curvatum]|nr:hypothetical protein DFJ74DRAFT_720635 [Hyaloraphidium curvatum]
MPRPVKAPEPKGKAPASAGAGVADGPVEKAAPPKPAAKKSKEKEKAAPPPPPVPYEEHSRIVAEHVAKLAEVEAALAGLRDSVERHAADSGSREQQLRETLAEREEVICHLEKKVQDQGDRIACLKDDMVRVHSEASNTVEAERTKLRYEERRISDRVASIEAEKQTMQSKLDELEEFRLRKVELEEDLARLQAELATKTKEHKEAIRDLEVKSLRDKAFVKKQAMDMVSDAIAAFKDVAEKQLSESTKHAMRENQMMDSQIRLLSSKLAKMVPVNTSLKARIRDLKTELSLAAEREKILLGRQKKRDELIKVLAEKLRECDSLLLKMLDEVEKAAAEGAAAGLARRRDFTGRRGSLGLPIGETITIAVPHGTSQDGKAAALPPLPVAGAVAESTAYGSSVSTQRDALSRTLATVLTFASDEAPLPPPTSAFGMGTVTEEQDEEDPELWAGAAFEGRTKREMSLTVVEALAGQFREKLEKLTGGAQSVG